MRARVRACVRVCEEARLFDNVLVLQTKDLGFDFVPHTPSLPWLPDLLIKCLACVLIVRIVQSPNRRRLACAFMEVHTYLVLEKETQQKKKTRLITITLDVVKMCCFTVNYFPSW